MTWIVNHETTLFPERHESHEGYVLNTLSGWAAFVYVDGDAFRLAGDFTTWKAARLAVVRNYGKYSNAA